MKLADKIRTHSREKYVLAARKKKVRRFSIRAGDVVNELGIGGSRAPAVCSAETPAGASSPNQRSTSKPVTPCTPNAPLPAGDCVLFQGHGWCRAATTTNTTYRQPTRLTTSAAARRSRPGEWPSPPTPSKVLPKSSTTVDKHAATTSCRKVPVPGRDRKYTISVRR